MSARLLAAVQWAAQMHKDQRRKGRTATPYVNHCVTVAELLARVGGVTDEDVLIGAVLHDIVEDTHATLEDVADRFGPTVAGYVAEVSDDKDLAKAERKRQQVLKAPGKSVGAKLIKIGDKTSNVGDLADDPPPWPAARLAEYVRWAREVVAGMRGVNPALEAHFDATAARVDAHLQASAEST